MCCPCPQDAPDPAWYDSGLEVPWQCAVKAMRMKQQS